MADRALAFAAAVRVVVGVHDGTSYRRTGAEVSRLACLAEVHDFMLYVADLADGCAALYGNESHFAGGHLERCVSAFLCHYLCGDACCPRYLGAPAGLKLDCVNDGTYGDVGESKRVACLDVCRRTGDYAVAYLEADGSEDVFLFAVCVYEQCDVCRPVGIILDGGYLCGDSVLVPLEVDYSVLDSVADLLGSYWMEVTFAGIPSLFLLKSIILYLILLPPPM